MNEQLLQLQEQQQEEELQLPAAEEAQRPQPQVLPSKLSYWKTLQQKAFSSASSSPSPSHGAAFYSSSSSSSFLPLFRIPDYEDDLEDVVSSFPHLRRKTIETLYPQQQDDHNNDHNTATLQPKDKSPKGSVDEPIQALVDLINSHPSFCTLSSCSGRIALFDPNYHQQHHHHSQEHQINKIKSNTNSNSSNATTISGKGGGGAWLLTSHEEITWSTLQQCMQDDTDADNAKHTLDQVDPKSTPSSSSRQDDDDDEDSNSTTTMPWVFKHEPMILHVAASTWARGQQLLQLALALGFRESGMVPRSSSSSTTTHPSSSVVLQKITVMIRSHSLALTVPLARRGPLRPSNAYLQALVQHANSKLRTNWKKLQQLHDTISQQLFQTLAVPTTTSLTTTTTTTTTMPLLQSSTAGSTPTDAASRSLTEQRESTIPASSSNSSCFLELKSLPDLNLWGHASVVIPVADDADNNAENMGDESMGDDADMEGDGASDTTLITCNHQESSLLPQNVDIMVIGGYGKGPAVVMVPTRRPTLNGTASSTGGWMTMVSSKTKCQRSDQVYCLQRRKGIWNDHWMRLAQAHVTLKGGAHSSPFGNESEQDHHPHHHHNNNNDAAVTLLQGILSVRRAIFTPRESVDGCLLPLAAAWQGLTSGDSAVIKESTAVIAIWGGRTSPCHPLDELLLYEYSTSSSLSTTKLSSDVDAEAVAADEAAAAKSSAFTTRSLHWMTPIQVKGQGPSPRWGHTLTALSGRSQGRLAVVVGGRNEDEACLDSVHVLCLAVDSTSSHTAHFRWETIDVSATMVPRFFHSAVVLGTSSARAGNDVETVLVFGGKTDPKDLFESFSDSFSDFHAIATPSTGEPKHSQVVIPQQQQQQVGDAGNAGECLPYVNNQQLHHQHQATPSCLLIIHLASGTVQRCNQILPHHYDHHPQYKLIMQGAQINGTSSTGIPELGSAACVVHVCDPISGQQEELVLVVGGTSVTETDPFLCFRAATSNQAPASNDLAKVDDGNCNKAATVAGPDLLLQPCPVVLQQADDAEEKLEMSVFVHHRCVVLPSTPPQAEILLLGGGLSSFAFGPYFARSFHARVSLVSSPSHLIQQQPSRFQSQLQHLSNEQQNSSNPAPSPVASIKRKISLTNLPRLLDSTATSTTTTTSATPSSASAPVGALALPAQQQANNNNSNNNSNSRTHWTNVVLVAHQNAKSLKIALEAASLLDPTFRMTKSTIQPPTDMSEQTNEQLQQQLIAVPITLECLRLLQSTPTHSDNNNNHSNNNNNNNSNNMDWRKWVIGIGQQKVPFRTAHYARGGNNKK